VAVETGDIPNWRRAVDASKTGATPIAGLFVLKDVLLVWPTAAAGEGCLACVVEAYGSSRERSAVAGVTQRRNRAIRIGAQLLIQNAMETWCGVGASDRFLEIHRETLEITARQVPPAVGCPHLSSQWQPSRRRKYFAIGQPAPEDLVASLSNRLVDAKVGIISELTEGSLPQIPRRQSSAQVRLSGSEPRSVFVTDGSVDPMAARLEVLKRALEVSLAETIRGLPPDVPLEVEAWSSGKISVLRRADLPAGVVVAAATELELVTESFCRALAVRASQSGDWEAMEIERTLVSIEDRPLLDRLAEVDNVGPIRLERNAALSVGPWETARFSLGSRPVSIVAGISGPKLLGTGLLDLWLAASCPPELDTSARLRLRSSGHPHAELLDVMQATRRVARHELLRASVPWLLHESDEPLTCSYAFLVDTARSPDAQQRWPEAPAS
jgi:hypothetical protein